MQIASILTEDCSLRSKIEGYTYEDSDLLVRRSSPWGNGKLFIGYTPAPEGIPQYVCILHMIADGWVLLGPPNDTGEYGCDWWLTRERK